MTTEVKVKKVFQPIVDLLTANPQAAVSDVLGDILDLVRTKASGGGVRGSTITISAEDGTLLAIYDYYFKAWMPIVGDAAVVFGTKVGAATGLNNMCQAGVRAWTRRQKAAVVARNELLIDVARGEVAQDDVVSILATIDEEANAIINPEGLGFELDEVMDYLADNGYSAVAPRAKKTGSEYDDE